MLFLWVEDTVLPFLDQRSHVDPPQSAAHTERDLGNGREETKKRPVKQPYREGKRTCRTALQK